MTTTSHSHVIVDTSALVFLHVVSPELLRELYGHILVPDVVWAEVEAGLRAGAPGPDVRAVSWMELRPTVPSPLVTSSFPKVDPGEIAVLSLALQLGPAQAFTVLDDRDASRAARTLGIATTGILGVLIEAKEAGLIARVRPLVDLLRAADFWVSDHVIAQALRRAGE
jgi:uncharacterized protein